MKKLTLLIGFVFFSSAMVTAQAECTEEPPDGLAPIAAFSIFQSNYQNKDYPFALKYGRWILCSKPKEIENYPAFKLSTQLDKFVTIYGEMAKGESDPAIKAAYLDSAVMAMDDKIEIFSDDIAEVYKAHQRKGRFYLENYSYINDGLGKAYAEFQTMFDMNPERTTTSARGYYVDALLRNYVNKGERDLAQNVIDEASKYATGDLVQKIDDYQEDLLSSPEDVIGYYGPKLEENPNDVAALEALARAYEQLDDQEMLVETQRKLHEVSPSYESAIALARTEKGNARNEDAIKHFKEALEMTDDADQMKRINVDIADSYISMGDLKTADTFLDEAISIDENYGQAYINKARVYAEAVTRCTADRKLEAKDRMVYWLVIDYLNMAKSKDASVASTVNSQLPNYEQVTPTGEDKFLRLDNLQNGQKVKIDGSIAPCYSWINKTTTVR